jgi:hypothetical protein
LTPKVLLVAVSEQRRGRSRSRGPVREPGALINGSARERYDEGDEKYASSSLEALWKFKLALNLG